MSDSINSSDATTASKSSITSRALVVPCDTWPPPYVIDGPLRRVKPYFFTYNTYCKERWRGRTILDIFSTEFRERSADYYKEAMLSGRLVVNGQRVNSVEQIIRNGDIISHSLHRHEPPVTSAEINIIFENDELLVVNKPAGVPIHPTGRYNFNTLVEILKSQRGRDFKVMPCHRLDRLTSGVMVFGKTSQAAKRMSEIFRDRDARKEYVARVIGKFPEGEIICDKPIIQVNAKLGLNRVRAEGKSARSVFERLLYVDDGITKRTFNASDMDGHKNNQNVDSKGYEDETGKNDERIDLSSNIMEKGMGQRAWTDNKMKGWSIVKCKPETGRTHQLRVHLQYLGHPIGNDPIYANKRVFGANLGAGEASYEERRDNEIIRRLNLMGKSEQAKAIEYDESASKKGGERLLKEKCSVCNTRLYSDPGEHELGIWLHAQRYEIYDAKANQLYTFVAEPPEWYVKEFHEYT